MTDDDRVLGLFRKLAGEIRAGGGDGLEALVREAGADPERRVGAYVILDEIGAGGSGRVMRAWHTQLKRCCAIKFLAAESGDARQRLEREARIAAQLAHPCIVTVHEIGTHRDSPYIVMEHVDGPTLGQVRMTPREALEIIQVVAQAVQFAHERGILHRDLKPANILLGADGRPRITDFGLARLQQGGTTITAPGTFVGTPAYVAPEVAAGGAPTARADVYGLGATLYHLLAGLPPYDGVSVLEVLQKISAGEPPPLSVRAPSVNRDVATIVATATARDPRARYASAGAMAEDIRRYLDGRAILARPESRLRRAWRVLARNRAAALALLLVAGAAFAGVVIARQSVDATSLADREREISSLMDVASAIRKRAEGLQYAENGTIARVRETAATALVPLRQAVALDPDHARANALFGRMLELAGREDEALACFGRAIARESSLFDARYGRGMILLAQYDRAEESERAGPATEELRRAALEDLEIAAAKGSGWELRLARARIAFAQRRFADCVRLCDEAPGDDPTTASLHVLASRAHMALKQPAQALEACERALRLRPGFRAARWMRGEAQQELMRYEPAREDFEYVLAYDPSTAIFWHKYAGLLRLLQTDWEGAIVAYGRAIELDPGLTESWCGRARARWGAGDRAAALADVDTLLEKDPGHRHAYELRVSIHRSSGDLDRALAAADALVERFRDAAAWTLRGEIRKRRREMKEANDDCAAALAADPASIDALILKTNLLIDEFRWQEALVVANDAIAKHPQHGPAYANRAGVRLGLGDLDGAREDAEALLAKAPEFKVVAEMYFKKIAELKRR